MALAPYFQRSAVAAAQILTGFDEDAIRRRLEGTTVGIDFGEQAAASREGQRTVELSVRLLARLYPRLCIRGPGSEEFFELAKAVNPQIELVDEAAEVGLVIGSASPVGDRSVFIGSDRWDAHLSRTTERPTGDSANPLGAGAAACLGAAAVFRDVFLERADGEEDSVFSTLELEPRPSTSQPDLEGIEIPSSTALVGLGAIGNGALWALARADRPGAIHLVDPEQLETGNLQRYVMALDGDQGASKAELAARIFGDQLRAVPHHLSWETFTASQGYAWERVLVGLDSAADRRAVQASLPRWIVNGWTQPGDLGVSVHPWRKGACLACLYLPQGEAPNEDEIVASALGLSGSPHTQLIRRLLVAEEPVPAELLEAVAAALDIDPSLLAPYEGRLLRELYVEGICGGAAIPLDRLGLPDRAVHVPLAHQSTLAGILLASRFLADLLGLGPTSAEATRIDVMQSLGGSLTQPIAKDARGICICQDPVYEAAYEEKWRSS